MLVAYANAELAKAQADPDAWLADNRDAIKRAMRRPLVRRLMRKHPELANDMGDHVFGVMSGEAHPVEMSDEWKARLHIWITKALPVLKLIATFVPPPYNLAVIAVTVLLILIDTNRLQPSVVASVFAS